MRAGYVIQLILLANYHAKIQYIVSNAHRYLTAKEIFVGQEEILVDSLAIESEDLNCLLFLRKYVIVFNKYY